MRPPVEAHGEVKAEVFNVVQRAGKSENKDENKDNGSEFQEILYLDSFIFSNFAVRKYRNGKF